MINSVAVVQDVVVYLFFFMIVFGVSVKAWLMKYRSPTRSKAPVLMTYFTQGNGVTGFGRRALKSLEGATAVDLITTPSHHTTYTGPSTSAGKAILMVELPFRSRLHVLAIARGASLDELKPIFNQKVMIPVSLEGDFPRYFNLYIDRGDNFQLRYILDPSDMAYLVDFCAKYHWEIVDNVIYFVSKTTLPSDEVVEKLIHAIRPAVEDTSGPPGYVYAPKTWPVDSKYACPVCEMELKEYEYWHVCPRDHGQLMNASTLTNQEAIRSFLSVGKMDKTILDSSNRHLSCPVCHSKMIAVPYGGENSKVLIDTCSTCPYRWLDKGEFHAILTRIK